MAGKIPTIISQSVAGGALRFAQISASAVQKRQTPDRQINDLQQAAQDSSAAVRGLPYADGLTILQSQSFSNGVNKVLEHRLGRAWRGYEVKNISGNFALFKSISNSPLSLDEHRITLQSNANCLADVWIW